MAKVHKNIRFSFVVNGRYFEAVGFLNANSSAVVGKTMLQRTAGKNGGAISGENEAFLGDRLAELPVELREYCLITNERDPNSPQSISCFIWNGNRWTRYRTRLSQRYGKSDLVVRALPNP